MAGMVNAIPASSSMFIISTAKNSLSILRDRIAMPFLLHPSISSDMVWELDWPLRNSFAPKNARESSTMQFTVARQLKLHVPLLYFDLMVFTILSNLSYLIVC